VLPDVGRAHDASSISIVIDMEYALFIDFCQCMRAERRGVARSSLESGLLVRNDVYAASHCPCALDS
jgi:hypothetical protein